ncbi:uncharacterized protein LOC121858205 [Homarus americanus]|uniref:uncharacterized protein LOC121858205 n=1 Tax=Homarus americanus TaxID=6706 RepID=UPI001C45E7C1|nr:uncharacterized protein LOC121858205 [Homarus americanus]
MGCCCTNTHMAMHRTICCLVVVMVLALGVLVEGAPSTQRDGGVAAFTRSLYGNGLERRTNNLCSDDAHQQYMCEMCAKETKSLQVYTLCCNGADDAQTWCQSFLVYGINSV